MNRNFKSYLFVESKNVTEAERKMMVVGGWGKRKHWEDMDQKTQSLRDLSSSIVAAVNNNTMYEKFFTY